MGLHGIILLHIDCKADNCPNDWIDIFFTNFELFAFRDSSTFNAIYIYKFKIYNSVNINQMHGTDK